MKRLTIIPAVIIMIFALGGCKLPVEEAKKAKELRDKIIKYDLMKYEQVNYNKGDSHFTAGSNYMVEKKGDEAKAEFLQAIPIFEGVINDSLDRAVRDHKNKCNQLKDNCLKIKADKADPDGYKSALSSYEKAVEQENGGLKNEALASYYDSAVSLESLFDEVMSKRNDAQAALNRMKRLLEKMNLNKNYNNMQKNKIIPILILTVLFSVQFLIANANRKEALGLYREAKTAFNDGLYDRVLEIEKEVEGLLSGPNEMDMASTGSSGSFGDGRYDQIRDLIYKGEYKKALQIIGDSEDPGHVYYRGIIGYSKMLMREQFSAEERIVFKNDALANLKKAAEQANERELKARALLWYGMAIHLNTRTLSGKKKALSQIEQIITSSLNNTSIFNDALYYKAVILMSIGDYRGARTLFKKLVSEESADDQIYRANDRSFISVAEASKWGLKKCTFPK